MAEQVWRRKESNHWMHEIWLNIADLYRKLQKKFAGEATTNPNTHCHICNKTRRNAPECDLCHRPICEQHQVTMVLCTECKPMPNIGGPAPRNLKVQPHEANPHRFKLSEDKPTPPDPTAKSGICFGCPKTSHVFCSTCKKFMCKDHRSKGVDQSKCVKC